MNSLRRFAGALLALQLAAGCSPQDQQQAVTEERPGNAATIGTAAPEREQTQLVLAVGDSLYAGYGMAKSQSFPAALGRALVQRGIEAEVVNAGVPGDTTAGGRQRLAETLEALPRTPDLVILGLGANDALLGIPPAEMRRNLEAMLADLQRRHIPVLLTGVVAPAGMQSPYFAQYEAVIPELARRFDARLEPSLLDGVLTNPDHLLPDGLHPNPAGAQRMAERVAPLAAKALESADQPTVH